MQIGIGIPAVIGDIIGAVVLALKLSNPVGWIVLALSLIGTIYSIEKKVRGLLGKDYRKSQQKQSTDKNIEKVEKQLQTEIENEISKIYLMYHFESFENSLPL